MTGPQNLDAAPEGGFIDAIAEIAGSAREAERSLGEIFDALDDRAFGLAILILTIPCLVPGLPGAQLIAVPIFLLAIQIAFGRHEPWLPRFMMRRRIKPAFLTATADFAEKRLRWMENVSRPRWRHFTRGLAERLIGLVLALAALTIMLPITNTVPSLAITIAAVGLLQRDGAFMLGGSLLALLWITALGVVIFGLMTGATFATEFLQKDTPW